MGAIGSCTWITSKSPPRSSRRRRNTASGLTDSRDIAPFIGSATVRPSGIDEVGQRRRIGRTAVQPAGEPVVRIHRREHAHVVAGRDELPREGVDMPGDTPWEAPGIG